MLLAGCALLRVLLLLCRAEMQACCAPVGYDRRSPRQRLGGIPLLPLFTCLPIVRVFPSVFSWYSSFASESICDRSQLWSNVGRIPKEGKGSLSFWLPTGCKPKSLAASQSATYNPSACDWSFSALRNLASTTQHLVSDLGSCFVDQDVGIICIEWSNQNFLSWPNFNRFHCVFIQFIRCIYFWQAMSEIISSVKAEDWVYDSFFRQHSAFSCSAIQTEDDLLPDFLSSHKSDSNHTTIHKDDNTA